MRSSAEQSVISTSLWEGLRMSHLEWTRERDHTFGPFLYAHEKHGGHCGFVVCSRGEERSGAHVRLSGFGHTLMMALPNALVPPEKTKVYPTGWDKETIERMGRDWYWSVQRREFGLGLFEGLVTLCYGRQTMDSSTQKSKSWRLPWTDWRFIRHSHYDASGNIIKTFPAGAPFDEQYAFEQTLPTVDFEFDDFDGERITAATRIEEREWRLGRKHFKWLSLFRRAIISRSLDIQFSSEVGRRKGSWKGGTLGHSTAMEQNGTPETAFKAYCLKHNLTFVSALPSDGGE